MIGTILLMPEHNHMPEVAFKKYVDAILDLLVVEQSPGIKDKLVDKYGREELLFLGPDEGTAGLMDWASIHAKKRNASFWRAFTTGKSPSLGGIPHDVYGMTTRSIRQYIQGIYKKEGLLEEEVTKFQTGGPDGDLGSNEIKLSKDKTIAIVDGSGVLCDPDGLCRDELLRLASQRKMISEFDKKKLGTRGFRVLISENSKTLPDGTIVESGLQFRNSFHLNRRASATIFVPCGGRPEAINISNVKQLFDPDGKPMFPYIVEGANLFISQHARHKIEKAGVIIFKDSSANKGGVTSSSLEVLSGLAMTDEQYDKHMCVQNDTAPEFYKRYVREVQEIIERNATLEFECIWKEHKRTGLSRITIADNLSQLINEMSRQIEHESQLWQNERLRKLVISEYCPPSLIDLLDLEEIFRNVPENYLKAVFSASLASRFIYYNGLLSSSFAFFEYMQKYLS
jgi:glutamate dehydrogenase